MLQEPQLNCFEVLIAEKLIELNIDYKNFFWRAGLNYYKSQNNEKNIVNVQPYYYDYYLNKYFGIQFIETINPPIEEIIRDQGEYLIKLDYFYLNYCHMFQKNHHVHALIIKVKKNMIFVQDNYFNYQDEVEPELLISWWNQSQKHLNCKLIDLKKAKHTSKTISTVDAIADNLKIMTEAAQYENYENYLSYCGLSGLKEMTTDIVSAIRERNFIAIDFLLEEIDKICRSRKQAADFFRLRKRQNLENEYLNSYSKWSNIFLTLMKAVIAEKANLKDIEKQFKEIVHLESAIIYMLQKEFDILDSKVRD